MPRCSLTTLLLAAALLPALWACQGSVAYCDFAELPRPGWAYGDTVAFTPAALPDSVAAGALVVVVRHTNAYPYSNLWLEVTLPAAGGHGVRRDTLDMRLADAYGRWRGQGFGASYQAADTLAATVALRRGHPVALRHIMRVDTLPQLERIGIILDTQPANRPQ